jgi:hypothetical protein
MALRYRSFTLGHVVWEGRDEKGKKTNFTDWGVEYSDGLMAKGLQEVLDHEASGGWRLFSTTPLNGYGYSVTQGLILIFERDD